MRTSHFRNILIVLVLSGFAFWLFMTRDIQVNTSADVSDTTDIEKAPDGDVVREMTITIPAHEKPFRDVEVSSYVPNDEEWIFTIVATTSDNKAITLIDNTFATFSKLSMKPGLRKISYIPEKELVFFEDHGINTDAQISTLYSLDLRSGVFQKLPRVSAYTNFENTLEGNSGEVSPDVTKMLFVGIRELYILDLVEDTATSIKKLPDTESFWWTKEFDFGTPFQVVWKSDTTIQFSVYDSKNELDGSGQLPLVRTENLTI